MPHLEHDRLVFLALGETEPDSGESDHLTVCPLCRTEVETLRHIGTIGAQTQGLTELPDPGDHIWQGIAAEIAAAAPSTNGRGTAVPVARGSAAGGAGPAAGHGSRDAGNSSRDTEDGGGDTDRARDDERRGGGPATVVPLRRRRQLGRRWGTAATAIAAAIAGVVGTVAVVRLALPADPDTDPTVVASAALAAFGSTPPSVAGEARVFDDGRLHLHVSGLPPAAGYYQVWLIDPDTMQMFPVGTLGDAPDVLMPLPTTVDLDTYRLVDVSAEEYDNDPTHSGDSLLRGTLSG